MIVAMSESLCITILRPAFIAPEGSGGCLGFERFFESKQISLLRFTQPAELVGDPERYEMTNKRSFVLRSNDPPQRLDGADG